MQCRSSDPSSTAQVRETDLPWEIWDPLQQLSSPALSSQETDGTLSIVTAREKRNVRSLAEVPANLVTRRRITSLMERPKCLRPEALRGPWFPQLAEAFLLHLPGGFIGDNVVFDAERYYSFGNWWLGNRDDSWKLYAETREIRRIQAGISIAAWGGEAFQLFILDAMPKLAGVIDFLEKPELAHVTIVSHQERASSASWFWKKLGLESRVVQKPINSRSGFVVQADLALSLHYAPSIGRYGIHPRHCLRPLQRRLGTYDPGPQDLVLYLGRKGNRSVSNEGPLLDRIRWVLEGTGLELQIFDRPRGLQRDLELFRRAKVILGPHGGAFANLIFAQPGTHVIEFLPIYRLYREGKDPCAAYWGLSQAAGMDYWTVEPEEYDHDAPGMVVDEREVGDILSRSLRP